jgi:xanthine dehydrogenase/oxidase
MDSPAQNWDVLKAVAAHALFSYHLSASLLNLLSIPPSMHVYRPRAQCTRNVDHYLNTDVLTIEGLGSFKSMHLVQKAVANQNGSQCGFCTPGIVMSLFTELINTPHPSEHSIEDAFDGNLCRCTGYRPILDGAKLLACKPNCSSENMDLSKCNEGVSCKHASNFENPLNDIEDIIEPKSLFILKEMKDYYKNLDGPESYVFDSGFYKWAHPSTIEQLLLIKNQYNDAKIINGNTEGNCNF